MTFKEYDDFVKTTAIYPEDKKVIYPAFGLAGEVGEIMEKLKKIMRGGGDVQNMDNNNKEELKKEIGDVLWYLSAISRDLGFELEDVANRNLEKLSSRKDRGVIQGEGDNR